MGMMMAQQARQEIEKGCELFPETVKARIGKLDEHAEAKRSERKARTIGPPLDE